MLIIVDKRIPPEAKRRLSAHGQLMELSTSGITYETISGHPDIFFHQASEFLVVAPNLPEPYSHLLDDAGIQYLTGKQPVGEKYPGTSIYNAVSTATLLIHNHRNTDPVVAALMKSADHIHVEQGYTRCNLLALDDGHFITSDRGIDKVLRALGKDSLYTDPSNIILPGARNGFFGGCCGVLNDYVCIIGSLSHSSNGSDIADFIVNNGYRIIELYDGPLFDGGGIFFIN